MKRKKKTTVEKRSSSRPHKTIRFYTDGSGCRPDGKGSAIAWLRDDASEEHVEQIDGLTNNQAEYRAILSALESSPSGSTIEILSDSQLVISQIRGEYSVYDPDLCDLRNRVNNAVTLRKLEVTFTWVPRGQNRADKLFQKKDARTSSPKHGAAA